MTEVEAFMRSMLHFTHYADGFFWWEYRDRFGVWPTPEMKARGRQMREEYLRALELAKGK